jgi:hypothetical protein
MRSVNKRPFFVFFLSSFPGVPRSQPDDTTTQSEKHARAERPYFDYHRLPSLAFRPVLPSTPSSTSSVNRLEVLLPPLPPHIVLPIPLLPPRREQNTRNDTDECPNDLGESAGGEETACCGFEGAGGGFEELEGLGGAGG